MTTSVASPVVPASRTARPTGPSLAALSGLEIRKSLSTRSGRAVAIGAALVAPAGILLVAISADGVAPAAMILGITGMITALVLLALGVLSTAGEWGNGSIQNTFLLVPQRGRVVVAKVAAMAALGLVLAAVSAGLSMAALATIPPDLIAWGYAGRAVLTVIGSGAAFAVMGAGIGAAVGNAPAALTGTYLFMLGVLPLVSAAKPEIAEKLDPTGAMIAIAQHGISTTPILVIVGWAVVSGVVGALVTRRRPVA
jgi:ABC-2 type transport system permease protein